MPAATASARRPDRRFLVHVVDVQHPPFEDGRVDRRIAEQQPRIAVPEHRALACRLIDEDDGELVVSLADDDVGEVDVAGGEILTHPPAVRVVADRAEKASAEAERAHVASIVATWPPQEMKCALMRSLVSRRGASRGAGEKVDVIDGAGAEADNVHQA